MKFFFQVLGSHNVKLLWLEHGIWFETFYGLSDGFLLNYVAATFAADQDLGLCTCVY